MKATELRAALGSLVEEHGFRKVSRLLRELEAEDGRPQATRRRTAGERIALAAGASRRTRRPDSAGPRRPPSAADAVGRLELTPVRARLLARVARAFDERAFLPTLGEVRRFAETYGMEAPRAHSRAAAIPGVFRFLATMDPPELERILDDGLFAGPTRLGPIADAIRRRARQLRETGPPRP